MIRRQGGSVQAFTLFFLVMMLLALTALSLYVSSTTFFVHTTGTVFSKERQLLSLAEEIEDEIQHLCTEKTHNDFSKTLIQLKEKYADDLITIEDISSLINERFTSPEIIKHSDVASLIFSDKKKYTTDYGWASISFLPEKSILNDMKKEFGSSTLEDLFPLVNELPQMNVQYVPEELLVAVLKAFKIKNADEKAAVIAYTAMHEGLIMQQLHAILDVPENHRIFKFLGVHTAFWRISYRRGSYIIDAVFAGIPDKTKKNNEIAQYVLLERNIRHE